MHFSPYLFIYFYTLHPYNFPSRSHHSIHSPHKRINPDPEIPLNLRAGNSIYLYRELIFHFRPPGVQDNIQDKMEHNPYHDVDGQDIRDVHVADHQEVEQDEHQREHADSHHYLSHPQSASQQLMVNCSKTIAARR